MNDLKNLFDRCEKNNWIPQHECKKHLKIISQVHSVNSNHNIIIAQTKQCKICGNKIEETNPNGIK